VALTLVPDSPERRKQDALGQLDRLDKHLDRLPAGGVGRITRPMVADARRAIAGEAGWPADAVDRLIEQIVTGRFGKSPAEAQGDSRGDPNR
jgi:hypothetical protein